MSDYSDITTEELHLAYRVVAICADREQDWPVAGYVLRACEELLRLAYRARTEHDPLHGQLSLSD